MALSTATAAQRKALAIAPIPFAIISFLSSSYVIYYLLCKERQRLRRLYHRLVLAMNIALLPLTFTYIWSEWAVPVGTTGYPLARGTIGTCTAQGFICMMFALTVPTYYASLVLQAYLGVKNNFREERYVWMEKWVHLVAYCIPFAYSMVVAATDNFNPNGSGCWYAKAPSGCEADPDVPCERGEDIDSFAYIVGFSQIALYIIFPPLFVLAMCCWMRKVRRETSKRCSTGNGMSLIRESMRKHIVQSVYLQITLYLFSFWLTFIFGLIHMGYQLITGEMQINLLIFSNCIFAFQGFIFMIVYFSLHKMGRPDVEWIQQHNIRARRPRLNRDLTVKDIRLNVQRKRENSEDMMQQQDVLAESFNFNIFDGCPDEDSPWARFIDTEEIDDEDEEKYNRDASMIDEETAGKT